MKFEISTDLLGSYDGISGAKNHESFEWRVIQEGSPGAHVVFSISPPLPGIRPRFPARLAVGDGR